MLEKINRTVEFLKKRTGISPEIAIILGTGLGGFADEVDITHIIPYSSIPEFPVSTVKGHEGNLIIGKIHGRQLLLMQGRFHYYEGYSMDDIIFPIRVFKFMGINYLFCSNASGGLNPRYEIGDIMIITDHINLMPNPLIGKHYNEFGARFPDMSKAYDPYLIDKAYKIAEQKNIKIQKGCYVGVTGPTLETPKEYEYFRIIGADNIGMSTTPEIIAAHQMGLKCFAVSVITDLGVPGKIKEISHEEVLEAASKTEPNMAVLFKELIKQI